MSETPKPASAPDEGEDGDEGTLRAWLEGASIPPRLAIVLGLVLPAVLLAVNLWRVHDFTIDDSYISFRYARNLARGIGLVYNAGERIEGYTNFLFTVVLAGGIGIGLDPELLAKGLGAASAFGSLGLTYAIAGRLRPYGTLPCVATWLLASSIVFAGWSVFGLETAFFLCLVLGGLYLILLETRRFGHDKGPLEVAFPWSGLVLALAALTRPEGPLFFVLFLLPLGRRLLTRQSAIRLALFVGPVLAHLVFRRVYYGGWLPNTALAKTGNLWGQIQAGMPYVNNYVAHAGPVVYLALLGAGVGVARARRDVLAVALPALAWLGYVIAVGGDWMVFFRFMSPFEPLCFLLVDLGVRRAVDRRDTAVNLAIAAFAALTIAHRGAQIGEAQAQVLQKEKRFWDHSTHATAEWLLTQPPGEMALGDIGYVGYKTDYPILDLLGLVDPVISKLPGGYQGKIGPGFTDRLFEKRSRYVLLISSDLDCQHPSVIGSRVIYSDHRFREQYELGGKVPLDGGFAWCFFKRKAP